MKAGETVIDRRRFLVASAAAAMGVSPAAQAQSGRLPMVGVVWFTSAAAVRPIEIAFKEGLRALGYAEGRNIEIVTRYADGNPERLPALISEQASRRVDVMFVSSRALPAAKEHAGRIPVVCAGFSDPVAEGFAASLAKPGGNFTGLSWSSALTTMKRLELAREVMPALRMVGMLYDPTDPQTLIEVKQARAAAAGLGLELRTFALKPPGDSGLGLEAIAQGSVQALFVSDFPLATQHREAICSFAVDNRIPLFAESPLFAETGALLSFGADGIDMFRRGASYVDRILKGARAGDLPIEQPNRFLLVVNQRTERAIQAKIPEAVLFRADKLIR